MDHISSVSQMWSVTKHTRSLFFTEDCQICFTVELILYIRSGLSSFVQSSVSRRDAFLVTLSYLLSRSTELNTTIFPHHMQLLAQHRYNCHFEQWFEQISQHFPKIFYQSCPLYTLHSLGVCISHRTFLL